MKTDRVRRYQGHVELGLDKIGLGVFLYAYAVLLGACYVFAFWRPIGFNIFPHLGLQDYVSAPLNRVAVLVAVPLVFAATFIAGARTEKSTLSRDVVAYLVFSYGIIFAADFYQAVSRYRAATFYFENEISVLLIALLLFVVGAGLAIHAYLAFAKLSLQIVALVLLQSSVSMAAGYSDGKAVYNGAQQVYFLVNKEICEPGGVRDWVHIGAFGGQTFFMNTIDKRLCLSDQKNLRLVSRKVQEKL
jgi:hypothetical protein